MVEDDDSVVDAIRLVLEGVGWIIRTYSTAESFLAELDNYKPNCVILDPHLPGMTGAGVAHRLSSSAKIPFIALTARPASLITAEVADLGAHAILTKPVSAEELVARVEAAMRADTLCV
ncbi:MAG: DNA-binding response OmpR family regulator [Gammaproteobacteria bacterium]